MELISTFDKVFRFFFCVINIYSKYIWPVPLIDKKGTTIAKAFPKKLDESNRKPNEEWVDKVANFTIDQWNHGCRIVI